METRQDTGDEENRNEAKAAALAGDYTAVVAKLDAAIKRLQAMGISTQGLSAQGAGVNLRDAEALAQVLAKASADLNGAEGQELQRIAGEAILGGLASLEALQFLGKEKEQDSSKSLFF